MQVTFTGIWETWKGDGDAIDSCAIITTEASNSRGRFTAVGRLSCAALTRMFAGHEHRYQRFIRRGMNYYQLATTGGGSSLRGLRRGEIDHFAWVTMKKDGPVVANVLLDGILPLVNLVCR